MSDIFSLVTEIMDSFRRMEERKEVDQTIVKQLNLFSRELYAKEKLWVSRPDVPSGIAFTLYLASRNSKMIIEKLVAKIEKATELKQNPHVIHEAKHVIPLILDIYLNLEKAENRVPEVGFNLQKRIFDMVKSLRDLARKFNLLPTFEEETKGIDKKIIKEQFSRWDRRIWMKTAYEL